MADVLDRPVAVSATPETALLGAAILAGVGVGLFDDVRTAQAAMCGVERVLEPHADAAARYHEVYARYREVEDHLLVLGEQRGKESADARSH